MPDPAYNVCEKCKERKLVCCGFDESCKGLQDPLHPDKDFPGPSFCRECCPWKERHEQVRMLSTEEARKLVNSVKFL